MLIYILYNMNLMIHLDIYIHLFIIPPAPTAPPLNKEGLEDFGHNKLGGPKLRIQGGGLTNSGGQEDFQLKASTILTIIASIHAS